MEDKAEQPTLMYHPNSEETRQLLNLISDEDKIVSRDSIRNIYNRFFIAFSTFERAYRALTRDLVNSDDKKKIYKNLQQVYNISQ